MISSSERGGRKEKVSKNLLSIGFHTYIYKYRQVKERDPRLQCALEGFFAAITMCAMALPDTIHTHAVAECTTKDDKHTWKAEAFLAETVAALKVVALEAGFMAALRAATTGAETIAEAIATIVIFERSFMRTRHKNVIK